MNRRMAELSWCILKRESELRSYHSPAVNFIVYAVNQHRSKIHCGKVLKEAIADTKVFHMSSHASSLFIWNSITWPNLFSSPYHKDTKARLFQEPLKEIPLSGTILWEPSLLKTSLAKFSFRTISEFKNQTSHRQHHPRIWRRTLPPPRQRSQRDYQKIPKMRYVWQSSYTTKAFHAKTNWTGKTSKGSSTQRRLASSPTSRASSRAKKRKRDMRKLSATRIVLGIMWK